MEQYYCKYCNNRDQYTFILDHQHGCSICSKCGCVVESYVMQNVSFSDRTHHNVGNRGDLHLNIGTKRKKTETFSKNVSRKTGTTDNILKFARTSNSPKYIKLQQVVSHIEYFVTFFRVSDNIVQNASLFYERNQDLYESNYVAKKETWAAAAFFLACESQNFKITLTELAYTLSDLEPKNISKMINIIRDNDKTLLNKTQTKMNMNIRSVPRIAHRLNMSFKATVLTEKIVEFIDSEELIRGLNPRSILSVSFFLSLALIRGTDDVKDEVFIKSTLAEVSDMILIAVNTIRKGIVEAREGILEIVENTPSLNISKTSLERVKSWKF